MMKKFSIIFFCFHFLYSQAQDRINREEVVKRHNIHITKADPLSSLTVGNGKFAFTVDVTGMQSFPGYYAKGVPLGTQSEWGWHSFPNSNHYRFEETLKVYELEGRKIPYPVQLKEPDRNKNAVEYFRANPHRLQLGNIGLEIQKKDGSLAIIDDIKNIKQELNLWTGEIKSQFAVEGNQVEVSTFCDNEKDALSFNIESGLLETGRLKIRIQFPYPSEEWKDAGTNFSTDNKHISFIEKSVPGGAKILHQLDTTAYYAWLIWGMKGNLLKTKDHYFILNPDVNQKKFSFSVRFTPYKDSFDIKELHTNSWIRNSSITGWKKFWQSGGAIDFSESTDPRAVELERRVILSQYLMRVQEASGFPPQETGLTFNSWYGRPHLEMHWWHAVHWALWGRTDLLEKNLDWYFTVADEAKKIAKRQGFDGLRWQKMTDHQGGEAPSSVGSFLIWQQPHFIYMAELLYRDKKNKAVLEKYKDILFATADFMASYPSYDEKTKKYNLGTGLIPAQECFDAITTYNPTYELAYWHWALNVAQEWRLRSGMERNKKWDAIINNLAPLPMRDDVYLATESTPDCYEPGSRYLTDHPAVLGAYASIPASNGLDAAIMKNTFEKVWDVWQWKETWGWDFPLTAMAATRLSLPDKAMDVLFMPVQTNTYLANGHNYQDDRLTIYLPGNGGLLAAVAMMCAGFDGTHINEPGFPKDGTWKVRWEGLKKIF